jgi:DNA-binding HxlR family transcriptional regulator
MTTKRHPYNQWSPDARALDLVGDKWTLLIVRDLLVGPTRFVELQRRLPGISTEQLRTRLNQMVASGLLTRTRYREVPPRVDYELTEKGRALVGVLGAVADWGREHAWGEPREGEAVDVTAHFRTLPATLDVRPFWAYGRVVLIVADVEVTAHVVAVENGKVTVSMADSIAVDDDTTVIEGAATDWVDALAGGPVDQLGVTGSMRAAELVLDALGCCAPVVSIGAAA